MDKDITSYLKVYNNQCEQTVKELEEQSEKHESREVK
jgi:hypothetical protein